jgi:Flp pilus assembly protein TadD
VALLREGGPRAAVEALEKFEEMKNDNTHNHRFFLAMAYWQIGEKDRARQAYEQAVQWMDRNSPRNKELRRFRAEAAELLKINDDRSKPPASK